MAATYKAILNGDTIEWQGERPPAAANGVEVTITLDEPRPAEDDGPIEKVWIDFSDDYADLFEPPDPDESDEERMRKMREAFEALQQLDPFRDIKDSVEWQREIRKDRPLPGRE